MKNIRDIKEHQIHELSLSELNEFIYEMETVDGSDLTQHNIDALFTAIVNRAIDYPKHDSNKYNLISAVVANKINPVMLIKVIEVDKAVYTARTFKNNDLKTINYALNKLIEISYHESLFEINGVSELTDKHGLILNNLRRNILLDIEEKIHNSPICIENMSITDLQDLYTSMQETLKQPQTKVFRKHLFYIGAHLAINGRNTEYEYLSAILRNNESVVNLDWSIYEAKTNPSFDLDLINIALANIREFFKNNSMYSSVVTNLVTNHAKVLVGIKQNARDHGEDVPFDSNDDYAIRYTLDEESVLALSKENIESLSFNELVHTLDRTAKGYRKYHSDVFLKKHLKISSVFIAKHYIDSDPSFKEMLNDPYQCKYLIYNLLLINDLGDKIPNNGLENVKLSDTVYDSILGCGTITGILDFMTHAQLEVSFRDNDVTNTYDTNGHLVGSTKSYKRLFTMDEYNRLKK